MCLVERDGKQFYTLCLSIFVGIQVSVVILALFMNTELIHVL